MIRRALFALLTLFAVLVNTAHVEAHASGQHSHDALVHDTAHHAANADQASEDGGQSRDAPATAEHMAGHSHIAADRSIPVTVAGPLATTGSSDYLAFAQYPLPAAARAPLLEPPAA